MFLLVQFSISLLSQHCAYFLIGFRHKKQLGQGLGKHQGLDLNISFGRHTPTPLEKWPTFRKKHIIIIYCIFDYLRYNRQLKQWSPGWNIVKYQSYQAAFRVDPLHVDIVLMGTAEYVSSTSLQIYCIFYQKVFKSINASLILIIFTLESISLFEVVWCIRLRMAPYRSNMTACM